MEHTMEYCVEFKVDNKWHRPEQFPGKISNRFPTIIEAEYILSKLSHSEKLPDHRIVPAIVGCTFHVDSMYKKTDSFQLMPEDLAYLAPQLQEYLLHLRPTLFPTLKPSLPSLDRQHMIIVLAERLSTMRAEHEAEVSKILSKPIEELVVQHGWHDDWITVHMPESVKMDPRIASIFARASALAAERQKEHETKWEQRKVREAKEREAKERQDKLFQEAREREKSAADASLREWSMGIDHLSRAAREGYDIRGQAIVEICKRIASIEKDAQIFTVDTPAWELVETQEQKCPDSIAFATLDRITKGLESIGKPECVQFQVLRIQRFRAHGERNQDGDYIKPATWQCSVIVCVESPVTGDRYVIFKAE
jgi:hypothetical protein